MPPIFETTPQTPGGAFTAENCSLTGSGLGDGAVVQRVNFSITRPINFIYEIGSGAGKQNVYYVGGRRQGQAQFERVVGGSNSFAALVNNYGPLCENKGADIVLTAKGGCSLGGGALSQTVTYTLITPRLTTVGASVSAQDIVIMETVGMVFLDLDYKAA
jgi:hypothetical protein